MPIRIAAAIKESREAKGLTQEQLAELVGTSTSLIGQIERSLTFPSVPVLAKLVDVLGIDANTLFYEDTAAPAASKEISIRASRLSPEKQEFLLNVISLLEHSFNALEDNNSENSHM